MDRDSIKCDKWYDNIMDRDILFLLLDIKRIPYFDRAPSIDDQKLEELIRYMKSKK